MERIAWGVAAVGLVFRLLHWPFGGLFTVLGFSMAAVVYFPLGWLLFGGPDRKEQLLPLSLITGLALSTIVIGSLFKLQFWPGADINLLMGLLGAVVMTVALLGIHSRRPLAEHYFNALRSRLLVIGTVGLLLHLVPTPALIRASAGENTERAEMLIRLYENPGDTAAQRVLQEMNSIRR